MMRQSRHSEPNSQITVQELHGMASLLVKRHGKGATGMARFLAGEHALYGDKARMRTWQAVALVAHDMVQGRMSEDMPSIH